MKQLIYKIIALVSILLGSLGPQVASGNHTNTASPLHSDTDFQLESTESVATPQLELDGLDTNGTGLCSVFADSVGLLLWQGCNTIAMDNSTSSYQLALLSTPSEQPELQLAASSPALATSPDLTAGGNTQSIGIFTVALGMKNNSIQQHDPVVSNPFSISFNSKSNQSLSHRSMVMRC